MSSSILWSVRLIMNVPIDKDKEEKNMNNIKNEDIALLFRALGQILYNQDKINKHLGINKSDSEWGWDDSTTDEYSNQCFRAANIYEDYTYD